MGFVIDADADLTAVVADQLEELDVLDFIQGAILPTDEVTIYTDADAALKVATILAAEAARKEAEGDDLSIADEDDLDEEELTELHGRLVASALTFSLRGIAPAAFTAIEKNLQATKPYKLGDANEEYNLTLNNTLVADSIVSVTAANGKTTSKKWTLAKVDKLMTSLYPSEANKLYYAVQRLAYVNDIFDAAVSADFS